MVPGKAELHELALAVLARPQGEALGADALAATATRAYADLVHVSAPLIGHVGVAALTGRALHLARREHPVLRRINGEPADAERAFDHLIACLQGQDPAAATDAAAAVFATFLGLLASFIGEPLTSGLLRKAWPDAFSDAETEGSKT